MTDSFANYHQHNNHFGVIMMILDFERVQKKGYAFDIPNCLTDIYDI